MPHSVRMFFKELVAPLANGQERFRKASTQSSAQIIFLVLVVWMKTKQQVIKLKLKRPHKPHIGLKAHYLVVLTENITIF